MDPMLVVSPHMDDAVLSVGLVLAGRPDAVVATIFTGTPARGRSLTTYDKNCGFRSAREAMALRAREDRAALALLGARSVHLGYIDHQYRGDTPIDEHAAADALVEVVAREGISTVLGPVGLAHPDHVVTARIFARLLDVYEPSGLLDAWLYEELPARVLWPELVPRRLDEWFAAGWRSDMLGFLGTGPTSAKSDALDCYVSQLWALDEHAVRCPERIWRIRRREAND